MSRDLTGRVRARQLAEIAAVEHELSERRRLESPPLAYRGPGSAQPARSPISRGASKVTSTSGDAAGSDLGYRPDRIWRQLGLAGPAGPEDRHPRGPRPVGVPPDFDDDLVDYTDDNNLPTHPVSYGDSLS